MGGRFAATGAARCVAGGVVQCDAGDDHVLGVLYVEAVDSPVLDAEVLDARVVHVIGALGNSDSTSQSIHNSLRDSINIGTSEMFHQYPPVDRASHA